SDHNNNEINMNYNIIQNLHQVHNPIANQTANLEGNDNEQSEQNSEEVSNGSVVLQQPHTTTTSPFYRGVAFTFYPLMFMLHPILNIFPCYTTRQLERGIIKPDDTQLKDCRGNSPISFGPASKFTSSKIQCNLEFRAPNGKFYNAPYAFVRNVGNEFEEENNAHERLKNITEEEFNKLVKIHTVYLAFYLAHWSEHKGEFVREQKCLFRSNAFTPVSSSHPIETYDYTPNKLKIERCITSCVPSSQYPNQYVLQVQVSFKIPNLYKPTLLENKRLKAVICTSSEQEPSIHPMYKIMNQLGRTVDSLLININEYTSM
ncbi:unnamed protein product, partial [Adineta steineri]